MPNESSLMSVSFKTLAIHTLFLLAVLAMLNYTKSVAFEEGVAVGRAEMTLKAAQALLDNQGIVLPSPQSAPSPESKGQKQSL